ncbi:N-acetylmuramoyl-L-alanine amidase [Mesobacillus maritimus]|uniref:N-acetylmuramoyl-L-alanine amidase n=1 Tax=Mesobacillus maritimus TaxID=1643336 RepID=UPI00384BC1FC
MVKIFIDPGHGGTDSGAVGSGLQEKNLTLQIAKKMQQLLLTYENVQVRLSRETDKTMSLRQRTDMANNWNADFLISVHINAGGGTGFETFIYPGVGGVTKRNQDILHAEVMKELDGVRDRGKKRADFFMLRESKMDAILTENLFIDNSGDVAKLKQASILNKIAQGHVNGVVKAYGLRKKAVAKPAPSPTPKPAPTKPTPTQPDKGGSALMDKAIVIGGFPDFASAEMLAARLKAPIYTRAALPNGKIAKELYVVGGSASGLQADKIISLTGKDRFEVAAAVAEFLNR